MVLALSILVAVVITALRYLVEARVTQHSGAHTLLGEFRPPPPFFFFFFPLMSTGDGNVPADCGCGQRHNSRGVGLRCWETAQIWYLSQAAGPVSLSSHRPRCGAVRHHTETHTFPPEAAADRSSGTQIAELHPNRCSPGQRGLLLRGGRTYGLPPRGNEPANARRPARHRWTGSSQPVESSPPPRDASEIDSSTPT